MAPGRERGLQIPPDAVEHLELEPVGSESAAGGGGPDRADHARVVGGERGAAPRVEQRLRQPHERAVDLPLVLVRHFRRLLVGALDQPHREAEPGDAGQIVRRAAEGRLQDDAQMPVSERAHRRRGVERAVDQRRAFHVDPDEATPGVAVDQDALEVVAAQTGVELEAELRQLDRQVAGHAGQADGFDHPQIGDRGRLGGLAAADVLAQVVERVEQTAPFQAAGRVDGLVDVPAADEPARDAAGAAHAVPGGRLLDGAASGQREEQPPRGGVQDGRGGEVHRPPVSRERPQP